MFSYRNTFVVCLAIAAATPAPAQEIVPVSPPHTLWRFIGIPQGIQKIRDVTLNRRGNFPGLERKPPLKRIADPTNLLSDNPAIKAAAEVKAAEDMKAQKIKAIKYLASMGCGCYDKDGKITEALLAATDDCTPDVRLASIEAVEEAIDGNGCSKCGSTSCCNEKIAQRLSQMAYERDDNGCPLEPSAEIRQAAKRVLCKCCPNRVDPGMIEEDFDQGLSVPVLPAPPDAGEEAGSESAEEEIQGESRVDQDEVQGEARRSRTTDSGSSDSGSPNADSSGNGGESDDVEFFEPAQDEELDGGDVEILELTGRLQPTPPRIATVKQIGNLLIEPTVIQPIDYQSDADDRGSDFAAERDATRADPVPEGPPALQPHRSSVRATGRTRSTASRRPVTGRVARVNYQSGELVLKVSRSGQVAAGDDVTIYHRYLTGRRQVAQLKIAGVGGTHCQAFASDAATLGRVHVGDEVVLR